VSRFLPGARRTNASAAATSASRPLKSSMNWRSDARRSVSLNYGRAKPKGGLPAPYRSRRTTRPGLAPVCSPSRITSTPLTHTSETPVAYCIGFSNVAWS